MKRRGLVVVVALVAALATPVQATSQDAADLRIAAAAWYLVGADGAILAQESSRRERPIASITKLMTALVALENARPSDVVQVTAEAASVGGSTMYLRAGEQLTVAELVRGLLVPSANDAAMALALHVGEGSTSRFVELMNDKARQLGLTDTAFRNPHGLDEAGHVSSARDATLLLRHAFGIPFVADALARSSVSSGGRRIPTTDDLLGSWEAFDGGKTGHTDGAGWSQSGAATARGATVYGTVLGAGSRTARNDALRALLEHGLDSYRRVAAIDSSRVYAAAETGYGLAPRRARPGAHDRADGARRRRRCWSGSSRPCRSGCRSREGQRLGRVEIWRGDDLVASADLVAAEAVAEPGLAPQVRLVRRADRRAPVGAPHVIVTVTVNAALDRTLTVPVFQIGYRHRSSEVLTLAGGKGINVARALKLLEVPVVATGLCGGRTGTRIVEELTSEAILNDFVRIARESRTSTAVVDPTAGTYTEINEWGPEVSSRGARDAHGQGPLPVARRRLRRPLRHASAQGPDLVLRRRHRDAVRHDVRVVLDSEGEPLQVAAQAGPFLVSPNQAEAEQLVGQELEDDDDFLMALDAIAELGPQNVLITLPNGCFARLRFGRRTKRFRAFAPHVEPVSRRRLRRRPARAVPRGDPRGAVDRGRGPARRRGRRGLGAGGRRGPLRPAAGGDAGGGRRGRRAPAGPLVGVRRTDNESAFTA